MEMSMSSGNTGEIALARRSLMGLWQKQKGSPCSEAYPDQIELGERTQYRAHKGPQQRFICWDAGGWEVVTKNQIRIQTASDEFVLYGFSVSGDVLTFLDPTGCEFRYRRIGPTGSAQ